MENNNFHGRSTFNPAPEFGRYMPMRPISSGYDYTQFPGSMVGRDYTPPDYNISASYRELVMREKIRQEIYAEMREKELIREELRREVLMETYSLTPNMMHPYQSYDRAFDNVGSSSGLVDSGVIETRPFQRDPKAMLPKAESFVAPSAKETELVMPKKPDESSKGNEGFAGTQTACVAAAGSMKMEKQNLHCYICNINATCASDFYKHLQGKKHKKAVQLKNRLKGILNKEIFKKNEGERK